jgi:hypothetical protein
VLLFQDIAVIPLILLLGLISQSGGAVAFNWIPAAKALGRSRC